MKTALVPILGVLVGVGAAFTGLGGGFLVVPLLVYLGFTPQKAVATSFVAILLISLSALFAHGKLAQVDWRMGLLIGAGGIVGAQFGARLLQHVGAAAFNKSLRRRPRDPGRADVLQEVTRGPRPVRTRRVSPWEARS